MITASVKIDRNVGSVWAYFTTPEHWKKWYGGDLKAVVPGWQNGGTLVWSSGDQSAIEKIIFQKEICLYGKWMDTTYTFRSAGKTATLVGVVLSDPKGGASFSDGGAAEKANREKSLKKLKSLIESETSQDSEFEEPSEKKWWQFWK